ncbi:hypothetical protein ACFPN7_05220 [Amycolatopsis halotolerans]|uniref:hypothetical protein n=1 Tax=Amycolatopsis halotolerans TaxID=330083 RepID=UPI00360D25EF
MRTVGHPRGYAADSVGGQRVRARLAMAAWRQCCWFARRWPTSLGPVHQVCRASYAAR